MAGSRGRVAAAAFVLAAAAAGCDALLGLGQFKDVPCAFDCPDARMEAGTPDASDSGVPSDSGDASDASDGDASDSADAFDATLVPDALDEFVPPEAASPHQTWAHWPMPNPDAAIAPDSSTLLPNQMAYDAGADGSALDTVTGLTWEVGSQAASDYVDASNYCQRIGMRLPTRIELVSLVDFTKSPSIDDSVFPDTQPYAYWTSSVVWADGGPDSAVQYWSVSFNDGTVAPATQAMYVRCVVGGSP
ncbi:MAG: DUF1566 domain-containing protein [Polyangiaceae bacterium]